MTSQDLLDNLRLTDEVVLSSSNFDFAPHLSSTHQLPTSKRCTACQVDLIVHYTPGDEMCSSCRLDLLCGRAKQLSTAAPIHSASHPDSGSGPLVCTHC